MAKVKGKVAELAKEYASLTSAKKKLQEQVRSTNDRLDALEQQLLTAYANQGITSLRVEIQQEAFNVGIRRSLYARPKDGDYGAALPALKKIGLADIIKTTFNLNTLSAWVKERLDSGDVLPKYFTKVVEVTEVDRLGVTKARAKRSRLGG